MNFQNFKEQFVEDVKRYLYENGKEDVRIEVNQVDKMNQSYEAMTVVPEGSAIGINIPIKDYFKAYEDGIAYHNIVEKISADIVEHIAKMPEIDLTFLRDYEKVKERLSIEVVSAERNAEQLENVPHKLMEDMAVVYRINISLGHAEEGTVLVNNHLLESYGISPEQLHTDAEKNSAIIKPIILKGIGDVMRSMMSPEEAELFGVDELEADEILYVATVPDKIKGAGVLAYDGFMDYATQKLEGDFFVLPSSVHEILLVKDDGSMSYQELQALVKSVNATEVSPEDQLTNSVYHYDSKNKMFELAEKYEMRLNQEIAVGKAERKSLIKNLNEKQAAVNEKAVVSKEIKKPSEKNRGGNEL